MRISYSRVNTYQHCPHRYQLAYLEKNPIPERANLTMGNAVHAALKLMHEPRSPRRPSQEEVIGEFCRFWKAEEAALPEQERLSYFQDGVEMLQRYYERESARSEPRFTAEVERFFNLPFRQEHTINGRIDRIDVLPDGSIEVLDYKTGRVMPSQLEADGDVQLAIYRLAAEELLFPDKTVTTSLYYLRHGMKLIARLQPEQLEAMQEQIGAAIAGIEQGNFPPRVTNWCDWCDYRPYCKVFRPAQATPEARAGVEEMIGELGEVEEHYRQASRETDRLAGRRKELQREILAWLEEAGTGFYQVGNLQVLVGSKSTRKFSPEAVRQILEPVGLWERVCKIEVTVKAIENLCRTKEVSAGIKQQLQAAAEVNKEQVLKLKRLAEEAADEVDQ